MNFRMPVPGVGENKNIPEDEVRVKRFLIQEIKDHPNVWEHRTGDQAGKGAGKGVDRSVDWEDIMLHMREAFKNEPALLAKHKVDTVQGLKNIWRYTFDNHRRKWANVIENASLGKLVICIVSINVFSFVFNYLAGTL